MEEENRSKAASALVSSSTNPSEELSNVRSSVDQNSPDCKSNEGKADDAENVTSDLYHYTKRGEFTSEIYKIEIQNLPRHFGFVQFKKMLNRLNLNPRKVKVMPRATYAYVTFNSEEERTVALKAVNGYTWKSKVLKAKVAKPVVDPLIKKRKSDHDDEADEDTKRPKLTVEELVKNAVTPLVDVPYDNQLKMKQNDMEDFLRSLADRFMNHLPELKTWIEDQRQRHDGMICELNKIVPSPVLDSYRNKNEFSIGQSQSGKERMVGFKVGSYKAGHFFVESPKTCRHLSQSTLRVVDAFQEYLDQSELPAWDPVAHEGYWNMLLLRSTLGSDVMAMLQMHPQQLSQAQLEEEKSKLKEFFVNGPGKDAGISSLFLNFAGRKTNDNSFVKCHLICGEETITEQLSNLKFRISKDSFFQINTKAAEVLYDTVGEWAELSENVTLLDVCCGTGTIALSLAKKVKKVIGVELVGQAVEDARANATLNDIKNAEFICGKAEEVLQTLLTENQEKKDIIGIVDPPRAGLHMKAIQAIRRCDNIQRLVYLACNPKNAANNFIDLCRPVSIKYKGVPFQLMKAIPVDLFPHTKHCELVLLFQRTCPAENAEEGEVGSEEQTDKNQTADECTEKVATGSA